MGDHGVKIGRVEGIVRVGDGVVVKSSGVVKSNVGKCNALWGEESPEIGSVKYVVSSSERESDCVEGVTGKRDISLPGLLLGCGERCDDVAVDSRSDIDEGEASVICSCGDVEDIVESRDVGASRRKLQSKLFLSQFAHDGCLLSHCTSC
jgi:hypothetical protein